MLGMFPRCIGHWAAGNIALGSQELLGDGTSMRSPQGHTTCVAIGSSLHKRSGALYLCRLVGLRDLFCQARPFMTICISFTLSYCALCFSFPAAAAYVFCELTCECCCSDAGAPQLSRVGIQNMSVSWHVHKIQWIILMAACVWYLRWPEI